MKRAQYLAASSLRRKRENYLQIANRNHPGFMNVASVEVFQVMTFLEYQRLDKLKQRQLLLAWRRETNPDFVLSVFCRRIADSAKIVQSTC